MVIMHGMFASHGYEVMNVYNGVHVCERRDMEFMVLLINGGSRLLGVGVLVDQGVTSDMVVTVLPSVSLVGEIVTREQVGMEQHMGAQFDVNAGRPDVGPGRQAATDGGDVSPGGRALVADQRGHARAANVPERKGVMGQPPWSAQEGGAKGGSSGCRPDPGWE